MKETLICKALEQIKQDIEIGDFTAIYELLASCPDPNLVAFLPEEKWNEFAPLLEQDPEPKHQ